MHQACLTSKLQTSVFFPNKFCTCKGMSPLSVPLFVTRVALSFPVTIAETKNLCKCHGLGGVFLSLFFLFCFVLFCFFFRETCPYLSNRIDVLAILVPIHCCVLAPFFLSQVNHLEQLCVNLCSETLQHFYNTHIFKSREEYSRYYFALVFFLFTRDLFARENTRKV